MLMGDGCWMLGDEDFRRLDKIDYWQLIPYN